MQYECIIDGKKIFVNPITVHSEGDNLSVEVANGKVIITPVAVIPRDELWAWSSKMRGVIEKNKLEAKEGSLKEYDSVEELWQDLHDPLFHKLGGTSS